MQTIALLKYPELIMAALLGIMVIFSLRKEQSAHCPDWLAEPAKNFLAFLPAAYLSWINRSLVRAGWRSIYSLGDFAALKIYLPVLALSLLAILPPHIVAAVFFVLFFLPDFILLVCYKRRQREVRESLVQAIDLMVLCVDAGLGLDATVQKVATGDTGLSNALSEELNILGREVLLGLDREKAYQDLYNRSGVDELKTFGSALAQASKLGLSIAEILRAQSEFIRKKQSQKIEEKAMKMPVYMAFPLWFCIMPSLMLLVLGPSLIRFYHQMH